MFCFVWGSFLKVKDNCFTSNNGGNKYRFTTLYSGKDLSNWVDIIILFHKIYGGNRGCFSFSQWWYRSRGFLTTKICKFLKHFSTAYLSANLVFLKSTPNVMNIFSYYESFNFHPSHFAKLRATYILNYILNYTMLIY